TGGGNAVLRRPQRRGVGARARRVGGYGDARLEDGQGVAPARAAPAWRRSHRMTPEQWTLVERLYHEASSVPASDRGAWLSRACGGDDLVHREVESLLAQNASTHHALDDGALAQAMGRPRENLTGKQLGGYTFLDLIDEGGMG